jgi:hypothetical protein
MRSRRPVTPTFLAQCSQQKLPNKPRGVGALVYKGGIDDQPTARLQDLKGARNFVDQALGEISQGKPVSVATSRAYGCSIKYGS